MNIYSIIANFGSTLCLVLGVFVLRQDRDKLINRLFFLLSVTLTGFIFFSNFAYDAATREHIIFIYYISVFFFGPFFAVNLHFNLIFTKHKLKTWQCILLYIPAAVVIITTFTHYSLFSDFIFRNGIWNFVPAYESFGFYFYIAYCSSYTVISIIVIELFRRKTGQTKEKRRAAIINSTYMTSLMAGLLFAFTLPNFGIYHLSRMGPNTYVVYLLAIYLSVFRYRFLNIMPSILTEDIIAHISDMVILLDTDLAISKINNKCADIMRLSEKEHKGVSIFSLFRENDNVNGRIEKFAKGEDKSLIDRLFLKSGKTEILAEIYFSKIRDKFGDIAGYVLIAKEIKGIREFMKKYRLTEREFEVIRLLATGILNKEISEKLNVAESTVKSHIEHIYNKTGAGNKVGLINLLKQENIAL